MYLVPFYLKLECTWFFTSSRKPTEGSIGKGMSNEISLYSFCYHDYIIIQTVMPYMSIKSLKFINVD